MNATTTSSALNPQEAQAVSSLSDAWTRIRTELGRVIIGQEEVIEQLLVCFFSGGHCLLVGVPGLAKTLIISSLSDVLALDFRRIQFTPDLMPSDITGTEILVFDPDPGERTFRFSRGPIFTHILLADEINRTPPKTQAALMEAMEEQQVTSGGTKYTIEKPFFVLATQNPIEQEGTYPLPAAQLDRFTLKIDVTYPDFESEYLIGLRTTSNINHTLSKLLDHRTVLELLDIVRKLEISDECMNLALHLVRASRPDDDHAPPFVKEFVQWGAGPRAVQCLILCGKSRAMLNGRTQVTPEDILALAHPVMRHRIVPSYNANAEDVDTDDIIREISAVVTGKPIRSKNGFLQRLCGWRRT